MACADALHWQQDQGTSEKLASKEGRIFLALISMGLDACALCTTAAIGTTEKFAQRDGTTVVVQDLGMARHLLAVLCVSLKPCGLTAVYMLYALCHLWRWMMRSDGGIGSSRPSPVVAWTHTAVGYFAAAHLFALYLVGAELDGVSLKLACPIASTLGLSHLDEWTWASWASSAAVLLLFLSSLSKVRTIVR